MSQDEYGEFMDFCRRRCKQTPYSRTGCFKYEEAYREGIKVAMSKLSEIQRKTKEKEGEYAKK